MNPTNISRTRKVLVWMAAGAAAFGVGVGAAGIASAASGSGSTTTVPATITGANTATNTGSGSSLGPAVDPATLPNGPGETVLTGDTATKVTAAALAADPGATVIRVETDSSGHAYEAHLKNADGSVTTLYFTSSFAADGQDTGFGHGGPGHDGTHDQAPATSGSTTGA
jgi:hypothetical protein